MSTSRVARRVAKVFQSKMNRMGAGFEAAQVGTHNFTANMDPFLNIDHFNMDRPFFGPHPHAGFCPVTFSLEDSEGMITNQDTVHEGIKTEIGPGDIFFSTAGSGLMHEEIPAEVGKNVHGLQMFINLSAKNKEVKAKTDHLKASQIPIIEEASGLRVRVVIGKHADTVSPLQTLTPITLLDIKIPKGVSFTHAVPQGWNTFLLVLKGNLSVGSEKSSAPHLSAVSFEVEGDTVDFTSNEDSHVVLAAGEPIKEPIIFGGPFVANTREQLQKFQLDYMTGKMGQLKRSF